jgi:hypothetical protein
MALLLLRNEADCLVPNMETESVSSHLPPELNRSPITARAVSSFGPKADAPVPPSWLLVAFGVDVVETMQITKLARC